MAQTAMFLAGVTPALRAANLAVTAERLMANVTRPYLMGTVAAEDALAIYTSRGQALFMRQMSILAKVYALARLAAYLAVQRLQLAQQRVPDGVGAGLAAAVGNLHPLDELGLLNDEHVEQGEVDAHLVTFGQVV